MTIDTKEGQDGRRYHLCETPEDAAKLMSQKNSDETLHRVQHETNRETGDVYNIIYAEIRDPDTVNEQYWDTCDTLVENHPFQPQGW